MKKTGCSKIKIRLNADDSNDRLRLLFSDDDSCTVCSPALHFAHSVRSRLSSTELGFCPFYFPIDLVISILSCCYCKIVSRSSSARATNTVNKDLVSVPFFSFYHHNNHQLWKEIKQRAIPAFVYSAKLKLFSLFTDIPCR